MIVPGILDASSYSPLTGEETSSLVSALAIEPAYVRRVTRFQGPRSAHPEFLVNARDLHEDAGQDGLSGLNLLHDDSHEIWSSEGLVRIERG